MNATASSSWRRFWRYWFLQATVLRAVKVAAVVGSILTLINQHDVLWRGEFSLHLFLKILLTFTVPYSVSSFSSARAYMHMDREAAASRQRTEFV
ncbi:MAG TPA: nitrate/nitrite transporter NrtS [Methylomirabilota bacterium]|jgi:hypothetical protein|nr:nitrate/nitrite transporter NrtS [Methylomirabilota bacterium]